MWLVGSIPDLGPDELAIVEVENDRSVGDILATMLTVPPRVTASSSAGAGQIAASNAMAKVKRGDSGLSLGDHFQPYFPGGRPHAPVGGRWCRTAGDHNASAGMILIPFEWRRPATHRAWPRRSR